MSSSSPTDSCLSSLSSMSFAALKAKRTARRPCLSATEHRETEPVETGLPKEDAGPSTEQAGQPRLGEYLEVRTTRDAGRSVFLRPTSEPLRKGVSPLSLLTSRSADAGIIGTTILGTTPTSAVLSTSALDEYCSHCFLGTHELAVQRTAGAHGAVVDVPKLSVCGGCNVARYCSKVHFPSLLAPCSVLTSGNPL